MGRLQKSSTLSVRYKPSNHGEVLAYLKRFKDLPAHCGVAFLLSAREFAGRGRRIFQSTGRRLLSAPATKIN